MKSSHFLLGTFICIALLTSNANGGDFRIFDANDQDLGILTAIDNADGENVIRLFIPSLGVFTTFSEFKRAGYPMDVISFHEDADGNFYSNTATTPSLIRFAGGCGQADKYYITKSIVKKIAVKVFYDTCTERPYNDQREKYFSTIQEISIAEIPFTLPVAFPLRYVYSNSCSCDANGDGAIDGVDLLNFANNFGEESLFLNKAEAKRIESVQE